MEAALIHKNGQPFFRINGVDYPPVAFMSYNPQTEREERFRQIGVKLFSFSLFFGDRGIYPGIGLGAFSENFWKGYGEYDFTAVDEQFEIAAPEGKGAFIFPRIYVDAPRWWHGANPEELVLNSSGQAELQSHVSEKWRADVKVAIEALIDHIRASKWCECVFGCHVAFGSTEECCRHDWLDYGVTADRSVHSLKKYREWLQSKYGTVEELRKQWACTAGVNRIHRFDDVQFPDTIEIYGSYGGVIRDLKREAHVMDYLRYQCFYLADTLLFLCKCIKEYTNNTYITGALFGYIYLHGSVTRGHNACYEVFTSPYIDFLSTAGAGFTFASAYTSAQMHGKLWFAEGDIRTDLSTNAKLGDTMPAVLPPFNSRYVSPMWNGPATAAAGLSNIRKGMLSVLTRNAGIWFFDMWGGWFDSSDKMEHISRLSCLMERQADPAAIHLKPRIAVIMDEDGPFAYGGARCTEVYTVMNEFPREICRIGMPYHVYLADDLADEAFDPDAYDLYIMLCCVNPSARVKDGIERLKSGKRTLLWMHTAGVADPSLSDFTLTYDKRLPPIRCHAQSLISRAASWDFPDKPMRCGRFSEADTECGYPLAYILPDGKETATDEPAILYKKFDDYSSVYCLTPSMPHKLLQNIAVMAGVFPYGNAGDYIFAGGSFVGIWSPEGGEKRIELPFRIHHAYDAITGEEWVTNEKLNIPMALTPGETRLFYLE